MKKSFFYAAFAAVMTLFVSCLDSEEDNTRYLQGAFTIQNGAGSVVMYMDGGNVVYPTASSVAALTDGKGFGSVQRALLTLTYFEESATQNTDGTYVIRDAELKSGGKIPVHNFLTLDQAQAQNVLATDSVFSIDGLNQTNGVWLYKGYMTVTYQTTYGVRNSKYVIPTLNATYQYDENNPSVVDVTLVLNKHLSKGDMTVGSTELLDSFDLTMLKFKHPELATGEVTFNINYKTADGNKSVTRKIKSNDFSFPFQGL